jgi:hypothetical protein
LFGDTIIKERRKRNQTKNKYEDAMEVTKSLGSFKPIIDDSDRNSLFAATTLKLRHFSNVSTLKINESRLGEKIKMLNHFTPGYEVYL